MRIEANILLQELEQKYTELIPLIEALRTYVREHSTQKVELADIAFACREAGKHIKEFERRVNELSREAQTACCIVMAMTGEYVVRTDFCSASSNPKPWFKIPYKREAGPEQWDEIMRGIGVSDLANHKDLVRIFAPSLMVYCGELIGEGGEPPAGIDPKQCTGMELNLRITKKRN